MARARRCRWRRRRSIVAATGAALGAALCTALLAAHVDASAHATTSPATGGPGLRDVLHSPPLLLTPGMPVTLRYEAVCESDAFGGPCALAGDVYIRGAGQAAFARIPLVAGHDSTLEATLPATIAKTRAFSYYAVIRDGTGETFTLPAGGASGPERAWFLDGVQTVELGEHRFGQTRRPDATPVRAAWGSGFGAFGLLAARNQATIGPSAFDVAPDGSIVVLDQINGRLASYPRIGAAPRYAGIPFTGGEGDIAIGADGVTYVLDGLGSSPAVHAFAPGSSSSATIAVAAAGADMLRTGPAGAYVHGFPGDVWLPVGRLGQPLSPTAQSADAGVGRAVSGGAQVVVRGAASSALLGLVRGDRVVAAWRVTSATPLGEIQLAEPFGAGLLAVIRVWAEGRAEFVALVLTPTGLATSFAIDSVEWAESAALGRFRLRQSTLYQLRSAPEGAEIVSFDLGGAR